MSILTAFGFTQFAQALPATQMVPHNLIVSGMEPFGARLDIEVIDTPHPVLASRNSSNVYNTTGGATKYIHFILNQRTLPLYRSFPACGVRDDGWCELNTFLAVQANSFAEAAYNYSCNAAYPAVPYGTITNGVPQTNGTAQ